MSSEKITDIYISSLRLLVAISFKSLLIFFLIYANCSADDSNSQESFGFGLEPDISEIEKWDIDISPDGRQLPAGQGSVSEGRVVYLQKCQICHGAEGRDGIYDQLVSQFNPENNFATNGTIRKTIGNFWPFATTLYDYINRAMPQLAPGSLTPDEIYSLVAYLLYLNDVIDENIVMDSTTIPAIEMPAGELFYWSREAMELTKP